MTTKAKVERRKKRDFIYEIVDLFCGAGGSSTGAMDAINELGMKAKLTAINHWKLAIATHSANHPEAKHYCQSIDAVNPLDVIAGGRLKLLIASPECTDHSNAKGGKPRSDQKRADAWLLLRWIQNLYVENILIENVPEFVNWGPLNAKGLPDKRHRGAYFKEFIRILEVLYNVEWRIINCADYGDATTRKRFFLLARRPKHRKIVFPEPTHASRKVLAQKQPTLFTNKQLQPWVAAKEIIDWTLQGESIFNRKKPLSENTMRRIFAGLVKYSLKDFLVNMKGTERGMRPIDAPTFTQTGAKSQYVAIPEYLIQFFGEKEGQKPRTKDVGDSLWTVTTHNRMALLQPFLFNLAHAGKNSDEARHNTYCYEVDRPLTTISGKGTYGLIQSYLVKFFGGQHSESLEDPIPTITANYEHYGLATPYLVRFNNNGGPESLENPLGAVTTKDRFALCIPNFGVIDIFFRMLQPHELAAAMSFPKNYFFAGNRAEKIKQIGNAVPRKTAKALCKSLLEN